MNADKSGKALQCMMIGILFLFLIKMQFLGDFTSYFLMENIYLCLSVIFLNGNCRTPV